MYKRQPILSGRSTYNFEEISKKLEDLDVLRFVSNKDEITHAIENMEAISDPLRQEIDLWLNESRGASKFISQKICEKFKLI